MHFFAARAATMFASSSTISPSVIFLAATSSEMIAAFGWVCSAHSSAMCDAERPISLMKCQYLRAEFASRSMLPMSSLYTRQAVSKPNDASIHSFFRSPSIVFGQPMT